MLITSNVAIFFDAEKLYNMTNKDKQIPWQARE